MSFPRHLLSSSLFAGVIFSAASLPLAAMGSQPLTIQLEDQPIFAGQIKELAGPYMGLATVVSLGAGVASLAVLSWSQSSQKLGRVEDEIDTLRQHLQEKQSEIETLKFSENRLSTAGLEAFLDTPAPVTTSATVLQPTIKETELEHKPVVVKAAESQPALSNQAKVRATMALAPTQAPVNLPQPATPSEVAALVQNAESPAQIGELLTHLKQVMSQIEKMNAEQAEGQSRVNRVSNTVWQQQRLAS